MSDFDEYNNAEPEQQDQNEQKGEDNWQEDDAATLNEKALVANEWPEIKLFGRWNCDDITISDISLQDYIAVKEKFARYLPHSAGRYAAKRFRKAQCPIVERLACGLMMKGRSNGKKMLACRIVKHAFEIIHLLTSENPLQVTVNAIVNAGPREDSTRIGRAGTVRRQAVDVSPLRRVNQVSFRYTYSAYSYSVSIVPLYIVTFLTGLLTIYVMIIRLFG